MTKKEIIKLILSASQRDYYKLLNFLESKGYIIIKNFTAGNKRFKRSSDAKQKQGEQNVRKHASSILEHKQG